MKDLEAMTRDFAHRLKRNFAHEITQDAKEFKKRVLQFVRRELPPRRGRPNDPRLDAAARMVANGRSLREVLRAQVPSFDGLDTYGRYLAEKGLRSAVTRRRRMARN
jgi:hypothetical protein